MADIRNNPHFVLFPLNNARTGYKPFAMPVLYVEPRRFDPRGNGISDSQALKLVYKVVDAPDPAKVNGPFNTNIRIPDQSLFEIELSSVDVARRQLDISAYQFFSSDGEEISFVDAKEGDYFKYTLEGTSYTNGSNPEDMVLYYPDAIYYDVSDVAISVEELPRPKRYMFVWESYYFRRIATATGSLKCISEEVGVSKNSLYVNHPGDVHEYMFKTTPGLYFDYPQMTRESDPTLEFYRPLADALQDVFDEQELLDGVNHINTIPAEFIPYLSFLIGWDLPNFPGTTDSLRRTILRRGSELQKLKSSRRVINELFATFGFTIDIINLWNSLDGNSLVGPENGVDVTEVTQTDLVLNDYNSAGFGVGNVPFVFKPQNESQIVLYAWLVDPGTPKYNQLVSISNNLSDDLEAYNIDGMSVNENGNLQPSFVAQIGKNVSNGVLGFSEVVVGSGSYSKGRPILNDRNIKYDSTKNILELFFDHEMSVEGNKKIFVFASYARNRITVPESLSNTRSNKFDIQILDNQGLPADFTLLLSLLDFLFKLKSFHSLLRKLKANLELKEVYNVTDMCIDGDDILKPDTTLGELQVPPAVVPNDVSECFNDNERGFKKEDEALRSDVINGLENEFQAWKLLDDNCKLTPEGQDKVIDSGSVDAITSDDLPDYDHDIDNRQTLCNENENNLDYCYKGRVKDLLATLLSVPIRERVSISNQCDLYMGSVVYWQDSDGVLRYTSYPYYNHAINDVNTRVINPFNIDINKDNLNFPSHRMISMNRLENDFNYTDNAVLVGIDYHTARRRPWDGPEGCLDVTNDCGAVDILNAQLIEDTNGDEVLIWDEEDLVYCGNGLISEISSLEEHGSATTGDDRIITHSVYQFACPSHPSIEFEQSTIVSNQTDELIDTDSAVTGPIFDSVCSDTGEDYIGGYPSSYNWIPVDPEIFEDGDTSVSSTGELYQFSDPTINSGAIDRVAIAEGLCLPVSEITSRDTARFLSGSMEFVRTDDVDFRFYIPYRLDCKCLNDFCSEEDLDEDCRLQDGDQLDMQLTVALSETMSLCTRLSNGELNNLFCINEFNECTVPPNSSVEYQDEYGIIYEIEWNLSEDTLDITVTKKDPRIPGEEPDGYVETVPEGIKIFRKGVVTVVRRIIKYVGDTSYVDAEGSEVTVGYFQTNKVCNDSFDDPFIYGINCAIHDSVELLVTDGPHWMPSETDTGDPVYLWADTDTTAPLEFLALPEVESGEILVWTGPTNVGGGGEASSESSQSLFDDSSSSESGSSSSFNEPSSSSTSSSSNSSDQSTSSSSSSTSSDQSTSSSSSSSSSSVGVATNNLQTRAGENILTQDGNDNINWR